MSQVGHGQVDHENDGFALLADEAAQDPQGSAVCQEAGDEYDGVRGCVQGGLEGHLGIGTVPRGGIALHLG